MSCRDAFQEAAAAADPCRQLSQNQPGCICEADSVSEHSPGVINNTEILARLIYSPLHVDPTTGLTTELAFSDVKDKGLSVQRLTHATAADVHAMGAKKLADDHARGKTDRRYLGIVTGAVSQIRAEVYPESARAFCAYDTAGLDDPAHADVCQTPASPSAMKRARKRLRDLFSHQPCPPESGLDS